MQEDVMSKNKFVSPSGKGYSKNDLEKRVAMLEQKMKSVINDEPDYKFGLSLDINHMIGIVVILCLVIYAAFI